MDNRAKWLVFAISLFLFIIPFFWLKPGEVDLGGDASRLYFYDPNQFLKIIIYNVLPVGNGVYLSAHFIIPYVFLLLVLKKIFISSYLLITLNNSVSLSLGFFSIYLVIYELLTVDKKNLKNHFSHLINLSSIFGGLFYVFSPMMIRGSWGLALYDQTKIFVYPLMLWFALKYINSLRVKYLIYAIILAFFFSHNFFSEPKFFAFFPFAFFYLLIYAHLIQKRKLNLKHLFILLVLFLITQSFQLVPKLYDFLSTNNVLYQRTFSKQEVIDSTNYFIGLSSYIKLNENLMGLAPAERSKIDFLFIVFPTIFIGGLFLNLSKSNEWNQENRLNFLVLSFFFLIVLFFTTGNLTKTGFAFYRSLFHIPGFSMFRSFFGQWMHTYVFFYSLVLGYGFFTIFSNLKTGSKKTLFFFGFVFILLFLSAWPLISGKITNMVLTKSAGVEVKAVFQMDPEYEKTLSYIKNLPDDGKVLTLPMTDQFYQIIRGKNGGAYQGPSTISYLTGKGGYSGYQNLQPLSEIFERMVKNQQYEYLNRLLGVMNIKYILYNSDKYVIEFFLDFPYQHMRQFMPSTQEEYQEFIDKLAFSKVKDFGENYHIYSLSERYYLPHVYTAFKIEYFDYELNKAGYVVPDFLNIKKYDSKIAFINTKDKEKLKGLDISKSPEIFFKKINPTKYKIRINNAISQFLLVFLESFDTNWSIFVDDSVNEDFQKDGTIFETWGKNTIADDKHILANGYANSWLIDPSDVEENHDYTLILELTTQRFAYLSMFVSAFGLLICLIWLTMILSRTRPKGYLEKSLK